MTSRHFKSDLDVQTFFQSRDIALKMQTEKGDVIEYSLWSPSGLHRRSSKADGPLFSLSKRPARISILDAEAYHTYNLSGNNLSTTRFKSVA